MPKPNNKNSATERGRPFDLQRPRELQDSLNYYLYHPLAWRIAKWLEPKRITPNMVSVAGGVMVLLATYFYTLDALPWSVLIALTLHMAWHVFDGADGDLARLTGTSSRTGELVDGICDYASHIVLYVVLGIMLQSQFGPAAWFLTLAAGFSRIIQANHYEVQRRQYQWWLYSAPWLRTSVGEGLDDGRALGALAKGYLGLAALLTHGSSRIEAEVERAASSAVRLNKARAIIQQESARVLAGLGLLGANYRTVALGVSMLSGSPLYYFAYEAAVLNVVLVRSIWLSRSASGQIIARLDQESAKTLR